MGVDPGDLSDIRWTHFLLIVHYWGASAMIALVFLHLLQVLIWGAYKSPRELQWVVGVLLLLVTLVLGLTGYLLPWDMDAYFASQVAIEHHRPRAGRRQLDPAEHRRRRRHDGHADDQSLLRAARLADAGGARRCWSAPTWRSSATTVPPDRRSTTRASSRPGGSGRIRCSWMRRVSFLVFVVIVFLALVFPPFLDQKADPTNSQFVPYPAWYFLSLFGLLGLMPPELKIGPIPLPMELIATIVVPTLFLIVVLVIPWLDRSTTRSFSSRKGILWGATIMVIAIVGLSIYAQLATMAKQAAAPPSPSQAAVLAMTSETTSSSSTTAGTASSGGGAASGGTASAGSANGAKVFSTNCSSCHGATGQGLTGAFPPLANNPVVTGDPNKVIGIVLGGLHGSIVGQRRDLQRSDAALERHALERRRRRRDHLHSRLAGQQQSLGGHRKTSHRIQALGRRLLPITLRPDGRRAVVVGGGAVAARKAETLAAAGFPIFVVAASIGPEMRSLLARHAGELTERPYETGDLSDAALAVAATDSDEVNAQVVRDAREARVLVCDARDPARGDFHMAATARIGDLTIAVDSGGASPAFAKRVARELAAACGSDYGDAVRTLAGMRAYVKTVLPPEARGAVLKALAALPVAELAAMNPSQAEHEVDATVARLQSDSAPRNEESDLRITRERTGHDSGPDRRGSARPARDRNDDSGGHDDRRPRPKARDRKSWKHERFRYGTRNGAARTPRRLRRPLVQRLAERTRRRHADRGDFRARGSARRVLQRTLSGFRRAAGRRDRRHVEPATPPAARGPAAPISSTKTFAATSIPGCANFATAVTMQSSSRWPD